MALPLLCECKPHKITTFIFFENLRPKKPLIHPGPLQLQGVQKKKITFLENVDVSLILRECQ